MVAAAEQQQQQHQQKKQENNNNNSKKVKFNNINKELEVCVFASSLWALFFVVVINFTVEIVVKIIQTFVFWYCRGSVVFSCFLLQLPPPPPLLLACVVFSLFANCSRDIISRRWSYKPSPVLFVWHQVWTERASVKSVCCCTPSPFMFLILTLIKHFNNSLQQLLARARLHLNCCVLLWAAWSCFHLWDFPQLWGTLRFCWKCFCEFYCFSFLPPTPQPGDFFQPIKKVSNFCLLRSTTTAVEVEAEAAAFLTFITFSVKPDSAEDRAEVKSFPRVASSCGPLGVVVLLASECYFENVACSRCFVVQKYELASQLVSWGYVKQNAEEIDWWLRNKVEIRRKHQTMYALSIFLSLSCGVLPMWARTFTDCKLWASSCFCDEFNFYLFCFCSTLAVAVYNLNNNGDKQTSTTATKRVSTSAATLLHLRLWFYFWCYKKPL